MRGRIWPRIVLFTSLLVVVLLLPHIVGRWPAGTEGLFLRLGLSVVWAALAFGLIGAIRRGGLRELREAPVERRTVIHLGLQVLLAVLAITVFAVVAVIWHLNLTGLALGGALTGVVVGLAAQSTLGNVIAGTMLLGLRPMRIGEWVSLRSWMSGGVDVSGRVEEINFFYTVLRDSGVRRVVPNSAVAIAQITVDETQTAFCQTFTLPYRFAPGDALAALAPYRRAEVLDVRDDTYVLRIEWQGDREARAQRLLALAERLGTPQQPQQPQQPQP